MPRYRRVNPEEREAINIVLSKRKLSQEDLAKSLHVSQAYLAQILSARRPLRKKYAEQIYKALEYDTSVEFLSLRNYREDFHSNPRDGFSGDVDAAWLNLYYSYCKRLEALAKGQLKNRVLIISDLEELLDKYKVS